jgi:DNA-binding CsgD family transcriptional regulator
MPESSLKNASGNDQRRSRRRPPKFSLREMECLTRLVSGLTDREIARDLGISHPTVRSHLESARRKVDARSRTHLAALVVALGVASPQVSAS